MMAMMMLIEVPFTSLWNRASCVTYDDDDDRSLFHKSVKDASIRKYDGDDDDDRSSFHGSVKETSIISEMMMMVMIEIPFTGLWKKLRL